MSQNDPPPDGPNTNTKKRTNSAPKSAPAADFPKQESECRQQLETTLGVRIANEKVCRNHTPPWRYFYDVYIQRRPLALVLGPRGGGKSFLAAVATHWTNLKEPKNETRILGGSKAQSAQVYQALRELVETTMAKQNKATADLVKFRKDEATYTNGANVAILAASSTSVRGPHVPTLFLDEVDEIDDAIREAAMGMCMARNNMTPSIVMTSTCHKVNGPMTDLMNRSGDHTFPLYTFCIFEVLEHCSEQRSGKAVAGPELFENCPKCPLQPFCHAEVDAKNQTPLAKLSNGHYSIDSLIQKVHVTSRRTFEADYLCRGPKTDAIWFQRFDAAKAVNDRAEYKPGVPVHLAIDTGVHTGAVFFQVVRGANLDGSEDEVHIFAEYLTEGNSALFNALAIQDLARKVCEGRYDVVSTDPAGKTRNGVGITVLSEYDRAGLGPLRHWPSGPAGSKVDGLALVDSFISSADGRTRLVIHSRCVNTVKALQSYRRVKQNGQWIDDPVDPQHPYEELVDSIRGGLRVAFPEGRKPPIQHVRVSGRMIF